MSALSFRPNQEKEVHQAPHSPVGMADIYPCKIPNHYLYIIIFQHIISCLFSSCRLSKKPNLSHQVWPKPGFHMLKARPSPKPIPFVFIRHLGKWPVKDSMVSANDRWSWLVQVCQFLALSSQLKERWDLECSWHHRHRPSNTEGTYLQLRIIQVKETSLFLKNIYINPMYLHYHYCPSILNQIIHRIAQACKVLIHGKVSSYHRMSPEVLRVDNALRLQPLPFGPHISVGSCEKKRACQRRLSQPFLHDIFCTEIRKAFAAKVLLLRWYWHHLETLRWPNREHHQCLRQGWTIRRVNSLDSNNHPTTGCLGIHHGSTSLRNLLDVNELGFLPTSQPHDQTWDTPFWIQNFETKALEGNLQLAQVRATLRQKHKMERKASKKGHSPFSDGKKSVQFVETLAT